MFVDPVAAPASQRTTGEESYYDQGQQQQAANQRRNTHMMNALYRNAYLEGNMTPSEGTGDTTGQEEDPKDTLLEYEGDDPGLLRYNPQQILQDIGYQQGGQNQGAQNQNFRPQFDFSMLAMPYGQIATPSFQMTPLQSRAIGQPYQVRGAQVSPNQMRQTSRLKNLALQNIGYGG
jgi:hypothetical protein